jgi:hypothetical protein
MRFLHQLWFCRSLRLTNCFRASPILEGAIGAFLFGEFAYNSTLEKPNPLQPID